MRRPEPRTTADMKDSSLSEYAYDNGSQPTSVQVGANEITEIDSASCEPLTVGTGEP